MQVQCLLEKSYTCSWWN